ncbi:MAG: RHS repeat protein [Acidobacteria bacterium]|nr:MAG: RHS repeat protein [Acidobacteriota bacterium]
MTPAGGSPKVIASSAEYEPSGPLRSLTLGNGLLETRDFDERYFPDAITASAAFERTWDYTTDPVGNITQIDESEGCVEGLVLESATIGTAIDLRACDTAQLGPDLDLLATADVSVEAGTSISFLPGFSVAQGGLFRAAIAPGGSTLIRSLVYGYQPHQHFLTSASGGAWGTLGWTYDGIGNRLTETRTAVGTQSYAYHQNASGTGPGGGNTAELATIDVTTAYTYDAAGSLTAISKPSVGFTLSVLDDLRLGTVARSTGESTSFVYDGRSFLSSADEALTGGYSRPTYSSEGVVHHLERRDSAAGDIEDVSYLYFAGRPVAQYSEVAGGSSEWTYLTTDHLGTPLLATTESGVERWSGPLEPFGADALRDGPEGALESGLRLRLPGQWEDEVWQSATLGADVYYNVHRWYEMGTGRYGRVDPLLAENVRFQEPGSTVAAYGYASQIPIRRIDEFGQRDIVPTVSPKCRKQFPDETSYKQFVREVEKAAETARNAPPCKSNPGPSKKITVKCGDCFGNCGFAGLPGRVCINVAKNQRGDCGQGDCLGSTTFHEFIHKCDDKTKDEAMAFGCEQRFYGDVCRFTIPPKFQECGNPCEDP